jgi:hypothetical protein
MFGETITATCNYSNHAIGANESIEQYLLVVATPQGRMNLRQGLQVVFELRLNGLGKQIHCNSTVTESN